MSYSSVHCTVCLKLLPNAHSVLFLQSSTTACDRERASVLVLNVCAYVHPVRGCGTTCSSAVVLHCSF